MDKSKVGYKLKSLREKTNYSVEEIAFKCDISTAEYKEIESGKRYPSDASLVILLDVYQISRMDLERRPFVNHEKRKGIINYVQVVIATLLVASFGLPFDLHVGGFDPDALHATGFDVANAVDVEIVTFLLAALILQLIAHFLMYTGLRKFTNAFKTIFLFITFACLILMPLIFINERFSYITLGVFLLLLSVYIVVTIYDLLRYPLENDAWQDKGKVRYIFVLLSNIVYGIIFIWVLSQTLFDSGYTMGVSEWIFFPLWAGYHISFVLVKKEHIKTRLISTIYMILPPIAFFLFMVSVMDQVNLMDEDFVFFILFMFLPTLVMNIDYFFDLLRHFTSRHRDERI